MATKERLLKKYEGEARACLTDAGDPQMDFYSPIDFLGSVGQALVGIGLQSFDNEVLAHVERSYDEARFEQTLYELKSVSAVAVEIILGLPGDSPENFRKSFERARSLPCACVSTIAWCCLRRSWSALRRTTTWSTTR